LRLPVTEDGKMLTPDQLEECFPVMTDLQVSKAVEAFYAASGMEPPPVEDAWGKAGRERTDAASERCNRE
jgi:hypothetical protein